MKQRNVVAVLLLTIVTLGIYGIVWNVKTKIEMNKLGAKIPTAWLIIVPLVNIWWLWKYSEGVEQVTGKKVSAILAFILLWILGVIGMMIIQFEFNKVGDQPAAAAPEAFAPAAPGFGPATAAPTVTPGAAAAPVAPEAQPMPTAPVAPITPETPTVTAPQDPTTPPQA